VHEFIAAQAQTSPDTKQGGEVGRCRLTLSKPVLKAPMVQRLKLEYGDPLSNVAFNFNLRRYSEAGARSPTHTRSYTSPQFAQMDAARQNNDDDEANKLGRVLHSFPIQLNLSSSVHLLSS
jgi:hypothetical protein